MFVLKLSKLSRVLINELREKVRIAIGRIRIGNPAKSVLMVGLRGVGKTVLLDKMRQDGGGDVY